MFACVRACVYVFVCVCLCGRSIRKKNEIADKSTQHTVTMVFDLYRKSITAFLKVVAQMVIVIRI